MEADKTGPCSRLLGAWPPIGYTDVGRVQNKIRKQVHKRIEKLVLAQYPELNYHPIALPENWGYLILDPHTNGLCLAKPNGSLSCRELLALPTTWISPATCIGYDTDPISDIDIIPRDEAIPVPSFNYIGGRPKRAVQMIPLLAGLGLSEGMAVEHQG